MRNLILGDIHGRPFWSDIIDKELPDRIIFLGDFVTTHELYSPEQQIQQLKDVLALKDELATLEQPIEVIILRGNHDTQGLGYYWAKCFPYAYGCQEMHHDQPLGQEFLSKSQWCYQIPGTNIICSHAGISKVWLKNIGYTEGSIVDFINALEPSEKFAFTGDHWDNYGESETQPCTWIRPNTLEECNIEGYKQVVGHTGTHGKCCSMKMNTGDDLWMCDALQQKEYLIIETGDKETRFIPCNLNDPKIP